MKRGSTVFGETSERVRRSFGVPFSASIPSYSVLYLKEIVVYPYMFCTVYIRVCSLATVRCVTWYAIIITYGIMVKYVCSLLGCGL